MTRTIEEEQGEFTGNYERIPDDEVVTVSLHAPDADAYADRMHTTEFPARNLEAIVDGTGISFTVELEDVEHTGFPTNAPVIVETPFDTVHQLSVNVSIRNHQLTVEAHAIHH